MTEDAFFDLFNNLPITLNKRFLEQLALKLPKGVIEVRLKLTGREMIDQGYVPAADRKHIDVLALYDCMGFEDINHLHLLKEWYGKKGRTGVQQYGTWFWKNQQRIYKKYKGTGLLHMDKVDPVTGKTEIIK